MVGLYPVGLELAEQECLVVGGGHVALRKVQSLLEAGARVTVVAPSLLPSLSALADAGAVRWLPREYRSGNLAGSVLVIAATDDEAVNRQVSLEARGRSIPVNVVDRPELCSFTVPAVVRQGSLTVAVWTGGESPMMARRIREELQERFGPEYGEFLAFLGRLRPRLVGAVPDQRRRQAIYEALVDSDALELVRLGRLDEVEARADLLIAQAINEAT